MKKKGSLRRISDETKKQVAFYVFRPENKNRSREVLANELESLLGKQPPSLDTLKRMISNIRNHTSPLDLPWTMATLGDYPLPPEGVAKVFAVKRLYGRPPKKQQGIWGLTLSIREALWISRLSSLDLKVPELERLALDYARAEYMSEATNTPLVTNDLDEMIYEVLGYPGQNNSGVP